ncbi:hypothetical protein [Rhizosphaericola mali]|jgi:uncharacterized membrane protein (UPF0136 family)|uniref:hypothetical protein n=1 Tax=Rhizosphaericola mali TaxID=2545455 RepID=UPI00177C1735|nr:hypothetical protein [Rhizosphaericola mali]
MPSKNNPRRRISLAGLIIIGAVLGLLIKNIKIGMIIGIVLGVLISSIAFRNK